MNTNKTKILKLSPKYRSLYSCLYICLLVAISEMSSTELRGEFVHFYRKCSRNFTQDMHVAMPRSEKDSDLLVPTCILLRNMPIL